MEDNRKKIMVVSISTILILLLILIGLLVGRSIDAREPNNTEPTINQGTTGPNAPIIPDHKHTYERKVIDPTCVDGGYVDHICECGYSYQDTKTEPLGHDYTKTNINPTCTEDGGVSGVCNRCGDTYSETRPATGHKYTTTTVEPTKTSEGYDKHVCQNCGDSYKDNYTNKLQ